MRPVPAPSYMPPPAYRSHRPDPIDLLPGGDELLAELTAAIAQRFEVYGERHVHPKRGGCATCAAEAADTVVRFMEVNTRVIRSDALATDEHERARRIVTAVPYLGGRHLRLRGDLGADPHYPTVDDLLTDMEAMAAAAAELVEHDRDRDGELRQYREWREAVHALATEAVERFDQLADPAEPGALT